MITLPPTLTNIGSARALMAPYARPQVGSAALDRGGVVGQTVVGPYVPEPWRGRPVSSDAPPVPWIDTFLSSTPALPMRAVADESASATEAWALDEAAVQMRALANDLRDRAGVHRDTDVADRFPDPSSSSAKLMAWNDDDFIDRMGMPVLLDPSHRPFASPSGREEVRGQATLGPESDEENSEAAARALETLAQRVRVGEITLPGYDPRLGDAAALATALAALLGARR